MIELLVEVPSIGGVEFILKFGKAVECGLHGVGVKVGAQFCCNVVVFNHEFLNVRKG